MRIISFITAALVIVALYMLVLKRDDVLDFAGRDIPEEAQNETANETPAEETPADQVSAVPVVAVHSSASAIAEFVKVRGQTEAARQVAVLAETSGRVISAPLRKGQLVAEDQVLCEIDPGTRDANLAQAQAALLQARAGLPEAQARLTGAQSSLSEAEINDRAAIELRKSGYASETRAASTAAAVSSAQAGIESAKAGLDAARAGISAAEAAVAAAQKEIERLTITAPFAGVLETDSAELGTLLQPGAVCATVIQLDTIKLVGFVPETEVNKVTLGSMGGARLSTGTEVSGMVSFLGRSADPVTRTFRVEVEIPNPDLAIRDGQTVEMVLSSGDAQAHLLPQSALTLDDTGAVGVRIIDAGNLAQFVPVKILRDSADGIWVQGPADQVDVITIGQEYVIDGVPVAPSFESLTQ